MELEQHGLTKPGALIDTCVNRPESTADLVFWDGEISFLKMTDLYPQRVAEDSVFLDHARDSSADCNELQRHQIRLH